MIQGGQSRSEAPQAGVQQAAGSSRMRRTWKVKAGAPKGSVAKAMPPPTLSVKEALLTMAVVAPVVAERDTAWISAAPAAMPLPAVAAAAAAARRV